MILLLKVSNSQTIEKIIWKRYSDHCKPDDGDDLDRLDRVASRDDRVNLEAIIWKRSQTTETIGTITFIPVIENKFNLDGAEVEKYINIMLSLFAKHTQKFYCQFQRNR